MFKTTRLLEKVQRKEMLHRSHDFFEDRLEFMRGPIELSEMIKSGEEINIIDVRKPEDFAKGHIPGAVNLPRENWPSFKGLSKDRANVVYCYSEVCQISTEAARYFVEHDFPAILLSGGIEQWKANGLPMES